MMRPGAPALGEWMLRRVLSTATRECVLGDLEEQYRTRVVPARGRARARLWYWSQVAGMVVPALIGRLRPWSLEAIAGDLRFGLRQLLRQPAVTLTVVATLSLGIGATVTMYSIVHGFLRELPFPEPEQIVAVTALRVASTSEAGSADAQARPLAAADFLAWRRQQTTLSGMAAIARHSYQVSQHGRRPRSIDGAAISTWAFELLGRAPLFGRGFEAADAAPGASPTVILSHGLWSEQFDADPAAIGRALRVDERLRTVIGVMPERFEFPRRQRLWIPLDLTTSQGQEAGVQVFGRLRVDVTREQAEAEFAVLASQLRAAEAEPAVRLIARVDPYAEHNIGSDAQRLLYAMLAVVSFVLVIACVNVANVLVARGTVRRREVAIRMSLGAGRARIVRQLLTETLLSAALGGTGGIAMALVAIDWFNRAAGDQINIFWVDIGLDGAVLAFAMGLTLATTLLAGLSPAVQTARVDTATTMKQSPTGVSLRLGRASRFLPTAEITLSCALLVVSGLMVRGVWDLQSRHAHFRSEDLLTGRIALQPFDYPDDDSMLTFIRDVRQELQRVGSGRVAIMSRLPGRASGARPIVVGGEATEIARLPRAQVRSVSPEFFDLFETTLLRGRLFAAVDAADGGRAMTVQAVVNDVFAAAAFPHRSPLGRRIRIHDLDADSATESAWLEIVGVIDDRGASQREGRPDGGVFVPLAQVPSRQFALVIESDRAPAAGLAAVVGAIAAVDQNLPVEDVLSLAEVLRQEVAPQRIFGLLFASFGAAALLLAGVGLYGVLAFTVAQRTREIGVRRALGASSASVARLLLGGGLSHLAVGLVLGSVLANGLARLLSEMLFGADPADPVVFGLAAAALASATLLAALVPMLRATRIAPMAALRWE